MRWRKVWSAVFAGVGCVCILSSAPPGFSSTLEPGDLAPDFTLTEFGTENEVNLYDFEDRIVLLEFFAYWGGSYCEAAASELGLYVEQYYDSLGGNPSGIPVELVSVNIQGNAVASTTNFINAHGLDLVLDDPAHEVYDDYGGSGIPQFALINGATEANFDQWEIIAMPLGYVSNDPQRDYRMFRSLIDSVEGTGNYEADPEPVPEPSTLGFLVVSGLMLTCRKRLIGRG